jgi:hypothetical protein
MGQPKETRGMFAPLADKKAIIVVLTPLSCGTIFCTCFSPRTATTFGGASIVRMLVLSVFHILDGRKLYFTIKNIRRSKNVWTTSRLKQLERH